MNHRSLPKHWAQTMAHSIIARNNTAVTHDFASAVQQPSVAADHRSNSATAQPDATTQPATVAAPHTTVDPIAAPQFPLVCAAGISPSGTVHIGNCREIFTVDFVVRYLRASGAVAQFYLFWDDYDALRKIPQESTKWMASQLRLPLSMATKQPDSTVSLAADNEQQFEKFLSIIGVQPQIKYQHQEYEAGAYTAMLQTALSNRKEIIAILNENRASSLSQQWWPIVVYSQYTNKDTTEILEWDGKYAISYRCTETDRTATIDIRSYRKVKLKWRIDWPMRWALYRVAFEPAGKDHHSQGGSFDTAKKIVGRVFSAQPPLSLQYDFISIKGKGGKISSSSGDAIGIAEVLEIYQPEVVRYLFASTRANAEFAISFDVDVIKIYDDYDKCELIAHGLTDAADKRIAKEQGIYWLSQIDPDEAFDTIKHLAHPSRYNADGVSSVDVSSATVGISSATVSPTADGLLSATDDAEDTHTDTHPRAASADMSGAENTTTTDQSMPQISFRHLCTMVQIYDGNIDSALKHCPEFHDMSQQRQQQYRTRAACAQTWIHTYAPDRFKFTLKQLGDIATQLTDSEQALLKQLIAVLEAHDSTRTDTNTFNESSSASQNNPTNTNIATDNANINNSAAYPRASAPFASTSTTLHNALYDLANQRNIEFKHICQLCYRLLIGRDDGPRLASFILLIGISHCTKIFTQYLEY